MATKIEWCDETWNPITGCSPISEGCAHCYARKMAFRMKGRYGYDWDDPFKVTMHDDKLGQPGKWKKAKRIFTCSMGDLFHDDVTNTMIELILGQICLPSFKQHIFMILTKRPERMRNYFRQAGDIPDNVWLGVTAENQKRAEERIPILLDIPAKVRFVSIEPMLGPVDMRLGDGVTGRQGEKGEGLFDNRQKSEFPPIPPSPSPPFTLDWVICGGETGPGARPMEFQWVLDLIEQCQDADVPFFFKKQGKNSNFPDNILQQLTASIYHEFPNTRLEA